MNKQNRTWLVRIVFLLSCAFAAAGLSYASGGHDDHDEGGEAGHGHEEGSQDEGGHEEEQSVKLTPQQMTLAGIETHAIRMQDVPSTINAPGEITLNAYRTSSVTPRLQAQVLERHARLGDSVTDGQPLLTLSSVEMANAQGELIIAAREWKRVKKLGRKVVSEQRYTEARVTYQQAKARVLAYGMTSKQLDRFIDSGDASQANGTFQLLSPQAGTVIEDNFIVGELIEPGRPLFVISDESVLWVEAQLTPTQVATVSVGSDADITTDGKTVNGKVVQIHHSLDEGTRTLGVRIEIANPDDRLHPGVFVQAQISSSESEKALAVPVNAVLRSPDGDWMIFTEHETGEFEPQEVELLKTVGDVSVIEGIEPGTRVVTSGAFFVQSELAKAGFEVHNH